MRIWHGFTSLWLLSPFPLSLLTPLLPSLPPTHQVEKEDRRRQNFAQASRDDGAWSKIVAKKEAEMQEAQKDSQ